MLLAIDTATRALGLALHSGAEVIAESIWSSDTFHTVDLAPEIALTLSRAGLKPEDLSAVAVAQGPGSYTGLRAGMALAKGLSMAHHTEMIGIPTLDIVAHPQPELDQALIAVLQVGRGRIAAVWYKWSRAGWEAESDPIGLTWDDLVAEIEGPAYVCGELGEVGRKALRRKRSVTAAPASLCVRRPSVMAELARKHSLEGEASEPSVVSPTYLEN